MSIEALSDSELRTKLSEYGYPVGPVTQTTRKILVKKLKTLMESRGAAGSRHSMAARYSSDDTDDDISASAKKKKKIPPNTRRQTLANPMPPPISAPITSSTSKSPAKKRLVKNITAGDSEISDNDNLPSLNNRSTAKSDKTFVKNKRLSQNNDGLETGSDSDIVEDSPRKPTVVTKFGGGTTKFYNDQAPGTSAATADLNTPKSYETNWRRSLRESHDSSLRTTNKASPPKNERYSVNLPSKPLDSYKNDLKDLKKDDLLSNYKSPYLSDFTRKLSVQASVPLPSLTKSTLIGSKYRYSGLNNTPEVKETDSNGHFTSPLRNTYPSSSSMTYVTSSLDKTRDKVFKSVAGHGEVKSNQNFISMVLVGVLALFFGVLAIVYLGLEGKTDNFPLLPADSDIPLCSIASNQDKRGANCVPEDIVTEVLHFIKQLHPILMKRAISAECDNTKKPPYINTNDIVTIFSNAGQSETKVKENLYMAHVLLFRNPQWGMSLIEIPDDTQIPQVLDTMEKVLLTRFAEKLGVVIQEPDLPLQCLVKKRLLNIVTALLIAGFGGLTIIGCQKAFVAYKRYKDNAEKEVFNLVSEIINKLELHYQSFANANPGSTQDCYLAINHIRDNLISPKDRKKLYRPWEKAVKFLDENESRIRREVRMVAGEEFQVWRWLPTNSNVSNSPGSSPTPKLGKVWQGSAFETMEGSVNSPACSPTPCLKIRHMFEPDVEFEEDWESKIKDAVLDKCGDNIKILHIIVDRGSREGCVYAKCMSQLDAGKAYKALHGSWFDGHLVTVKYLRLERYHERFPDSIDAKTPLKPSNNLRSSMQAYYWPNSSEAN